ncbi:MAG: DctP family TRAP transporter solute-binding subunit [Pseudomonadota bacterium]
MDDSTGRTRVRTPRRLIAVLLCLLSAGLLASCDADSSRAGTRILIKFPHVTPPASPKGRAADKFQEVVHERLGDRVTVEVYPSGQLMNDDDSIEALAFGEVQMIAVSLSKFDRLTKKYQVFDLPFMFKDLDAVERFQKGPAGPELLGAMADKGLQGIAFWHNGMKQFAGPVDLSTPDAADGLKFRIMESDVLQAQILQVGGNPQKMAYPEVYQALQTGAVDGHENTWANAYSSKFHEVQDYFTETNHGYIGYLVLVNTEFWNSIPADLRKELGEIIVEVSDWANERAANLNAEARANILASERSEIVTLTEDQLNNWRQTMQPVWKQFEDEIGLDLIETAKTASLP